MIQTNDFSKLAFFQDKDPKKIENQNPFFSDSSSFLTALQSVSEEAREGMITKESPLESEPFSQNKNYADSQKAEGRQDEVREPQVSNRPSTDREEDFEAESIRLMNESKDSQELAKTSEPTSSQPVQPEPGREEKISLKKNETHILTQGLGIASMLMPSFQKETSDLERFQEKLKNGTSSPSPNPRDLFPKKTEFKDTGDLMKTVFESQKKTPLDRDNPSKESNTKDTKVSKETLQGTPQNVKQIVDDLRFQASKTPKGDEKGFELTKTALNPSWMEPLDSDTLSDKKLKANKKKTEDLKGLGAGDEKGKETVGVDKGSLKETVFISKNSKEEIPTTISEKLKRTEINLKREKSPESLPELKAEGHTDTKSTEKNPQSTLIFDSKQKSIDSKLEIKNAQKPETFSQNFKEIVKAAKFHIVENGKNTAEISLQPKDLGKVTLFVSEENNRLEGRITVENESTRQMILGELASLKMDLKEGGLDLFEIHVDLQQETNQPFANGDDSNDRRSSESSSEYMQNIQPEEDSLDLSQDQPNIRLLDLRV